MAQSPSFYGHLTARETLQFVASFFFSGSKTAIAARIEELIDLVGLNGKADRAVKGFSGGERQRLGIAQAAINDPELIILDEPASALDPLGRRDVLKILESFRGRSTVFYSTHILDDVQRVSDRVVILERGKLVAQGSIEELLAIDRNRFDLTVRGDGATVLAKLSSAPWIERIDVNRDTPDLKDVRTTKLKIHVIDPLTAETELLRLALSDPDTIITQFNRSSHNLEDLSISLVATGNQHERLSMEEVRLLAPNFDVQEVPSSIGDAASRVVISSINDLHQLSDLILKCYETEAVKRTTISITSA